MKRIDIKNQKFGRLTALRFTGVNPQRNALWKCICECGNEVVVRSVDLRNGHTNSCGCYMREQTSKANTTHGNSKDGRTREYRVWIAMRRRCEDPTNDNYKYYGGKGIKVCEAWQSFEQFLADMGKAPTENHTIDRIDNIGNYEPKNCRWATMFLQNNNKQIPTKTGKLLLQD